MKAKVKEVSTPKFYFFDCGVVRALRNELDESIHENDKGYLLETFVLNEIQSFSSYHQKFWEFYYWGTPSQGEVDFIIAKGKKFVGLEVKASKKWKPEFNKNLNTLLEAKKIKKAFGIYLGSERLRFGQIEVFPIKDFLKLLHDEDNFIF